MRADQLLLSYWRTRRAMAMPPARLARHRAQQWAALQPALARTPALANYAGGPPSLFPMTHAEEMRKDYGQWNSLGLSDVQLRSMAEAAEHGTSSGNISVGWSTGSSGGPRGLFIADDAERADYIGQSLARLLPLRELLRPQRLALHLRANNALYSEVGRRHFAFAHFPLEQSISDTMAALHAFAPTILIAPPYRLLALAKAGATFPGLVHLFYGSEPMSDAECSYVAQQTGHIPQPIYQATEGFLGAACHHGRLHLNEHALEIELEPVPGTPGFRPVITDLRRRSQPVVRLRGDDYLELETQVCGCGFAGRVIAPVAGRIGDIWRFTGLVVPPGMVIAAVEGQLGATYRWQALASPRNVLLRTAPDCPENLRERARLEIAELIGNRAPVGIAADLLPWTGPKRRKVAWRYE